MRVADNDRQLLRLAGRLCAQLQHQAFSQVPGADTGRIHALQPVPCDAQVVEQFFLAVFIVGQRGGDFFQAVLEIAVVIDRLDQDLQGNAVTFRQAHASQLLAQMFGQADLG